MKNGKGRTFCAVLCVLIVCTLCVSGTELPEKLYPGGMLFGVRCVLDGVLVAGLCEVTGHTCPARAAGIMEGDIITKVNGQKIASIGELASRISEDTDENPLCVTVVRSGKEREVSVKPVCGGDGTVRAGIRGRDSAAGIGTVTFIDPETCLFGGLGHGICDPESGALLPLLRGTTLGVEVSGIVKGNAGAPGELRGCFVPEKTGTLLSNTDCGAFGLFSGMPGSCPAEALPVGHAEDVHEGEAEIYCMLDSMGVCAYRIEIAAISRDARSTTKNFIVRVTDPKLLERTGGIVQGMSGSPVIQDGKLVGAVTHVLVGDPARGFGIFIENMLNAQNESSAA